MKTKMPAAVWLGGPSAVLGYWLFTWLLENDPDHWLIRVTRKLADWIAARLP